MKTDPMSPARSSSRAPAASPEVSVIMPAFNAEAFIEQAIVSVITQTFENWELLVIDDGSTDKTVQSVKRYAEADARIRLLRTTDNSGPAQARNIGVEAARGRFIAFLDSDDIWLPPKLDRQLTAMAAKDASFCFTAYRTMNIEGDTNNLVDVPNHTSYRRMLCGSVIGCLTVIYDTRAFGKMLFEDGAQKIAGTRYGRWLSKVGHEDYALWLKMLRTTCRQKAKGSPRFIGINEPLAVYRLHSNSFSASKVKAALYQWVIYRRYEELPLAHSSYYFIRYAIKGIFKKVMTRRLSEGALR